MRRLLFTILFCWSSVGLGCAEGIPFIKDVGGYLAWINKVILGRNNGCAWVNGVGTMTTDVAGVDPFFLLPRRMITYAPFTCCTIAAIAAVAAERNGLHSKIWQAVPETVRKSIEEATPLQKTLAVGGFVAALAAYALYPVYKWPPKSSI